MGSGGLSSPSTYPVYVAIYRLSTKYILAIEDGSSIALVADAVDTVRREFRHSDDEEIEGLVN
jgi:hypothetical protein